MAKTHKKQQRLTEASNSPPPVVLSTGTNDYGVKTTEQLVRLYRDMDATVANLRNRGHQVHIIIPYQAIKNDSTNSAPNKVARLIAQKYNLPSYTFQPGKDGVHPADPRGLAKQINQGLGGQGQNALYVGDSIALGVGQAAGGNTNYAKSGMGANWILNRVGGPPQGYDPQTTQFTNNRSQVSPEQRRNQLSGVADQMVQSVPYYRAQANQTQGGFNPTSQNFQIDAKRGTPAYHQAMASISRQQVEHQLGIEAQRQGLTVSPGALRTAAAAVAGQAYQESKYNPNLVHDKGTGLGLYGHRLERRTAALNYMKQNGYDPRDIEGWNRFAAHEIMNDRAYGKVKNALLSDRVSLADKVQITTNQFENPAAQHKRPGSDSMNGRQMAARWAMNDYAPVGAAAGYASQQYASNQNPNRANDATSTGTQQVQTQGQKPAWAPTFSYSNNKDFWGNTKQQPQGVSGTQTTAQQSQGAAIPPSQFMGAMQEIASNKKLYDIDSRDKMSPLAQALHVYGKVDQATAINVINKKLEVSDVMGRAVDNIKSSAPLLDRATRTELLKTSPVAKLALDFAQTPEKFAPPPPAATPPATQKPTAGTPAAAPPAATPFLQQMQDKFNKSRQDAYDAEVQPPSQQKPQADNRSPLNKSTDILPRDIPGLTTKTVPSILGGALAATSPRGDSLRAPPPNTTVVPQSPEPKIADRLPQDTLGVKTPLPQQTPQADNRSSFEKFRDMLPQNIPGLTKKDAGEPEVVVPPVGPQAVITAPSVAAQDPTAITPVGPVAAMEPPKNGFEPGMSFDKPADYFKKSDAQDSAPAAVPQTPIPVPPPQNTFNVDPNGQAALAGAINGTQLQNNWSGKHSINAAKEVMSHPEFKNMPPDVQSHVSDAAKGKGNLDLNVMTPHFNLLSDAQRKQMAGAGININIAPPPEAVQQVAPKVDPELDRIQKLSRIPPKAQADMSIGGETGAFNGKTKPPTVDFANPADYFKKGDGKAPAPGDPNDATDMRMRNALWNKDDAQEPIPLKPSELAAQRDAEMRALADKQAASDPSKDAFIQPNTPAWGDLGGNTPPTGSSGAIPQQNMTQTPKVIPPVGSISPSAPVDPADAELAKIQKNAGLSPVVPSQLKPTPNNYNGFEPGDEKTAANYRYSPIDAQGTVIDKMRGDEPGTAMKNAGLAPPGYIPPPFDPKAAAKARADHNDNVLDPYLGNPKGTSNAALNAAEKPDTPPPAPTTPPLPIERKGTFNAGLRKAADNDAKIPMPPAPNPELDRVKSLSGIPTKPETPAVDDKRTDFQKSWVGQMLGAPGAPKPAEPPKTPEPPLPKPPKTPEPEPSKPAEPPKTPDPKPDETPKPIDYNPSDTDNTSSDSSSSDSSSSDTNNEPVDIESREDRELAEILSRYEKFKYI